MDLLQEGFVGVQFLRRFFSQNGWIWIGIGMHAIGCREADWARGDYGCLLQDSYSSSSCMGMG